MSDATDDEKNDIEESIDEKDEMISHYNACVADLECLRDIAVKADAGEELTEEEKEK
jgi:hypothetical protein